MKYVLMIDKLEQTPGGILAGVLILLNAKCIEKVTTENEAIILANSDSSCGFYVSKGT